jgi:uncharacterized protein (TIGR03435 family)
MVVATLSVAIVVDGPCAVGQPGGPVRPAFEVVSVKAGNPKGSIDGSASGRRWVWENFALRDAITAAYHVGYSQLKGAPDWDDARFRIDALMPTGYTIQGFPLDDDRLMAMLQTLLEDRFNLTFHWQEKNARGYTLAIAKNGPKLRSSAGVPADPIQTGVSYRKGSIRGTFATMTNLTRALSAMLDCPVADRTGMKGNYDFALQYARTDDDTPSLFAALQDQLGLRLESGPAKARILVVDHVERPTPN